MSYQDGVIAGQNANHDIGHAIGEGRRTRQAANDRTEYNELMRERNKFLKDYNEMLASRDFHFDLQCALRNVFSRVVDGEKLLTPPHDHGTRSQINYTVLMDLKRSGVKDEFSGELAFDRLMKMIKDNNSLKPYGLE